LLQTREKFFELAVVKNFAFAVEISMISLMLLDV